VSFGALDLEADERFVSLRRLLDVTTFGINLILLRPGQRGRIHRHRHQEEVYLVLEGHLTLVIEGEEHSLAYGDLARVSPEVRRQLINRSPGRCAILALGAAGEHVGRDGLAYGSWSDSEGRPPQDIPLPEDLPRA
jgi:uncharacterized cupin superfamily protein